jgi:hypothetical protein
MECAAHLVPPGRIAKGNHDTESRYSLLKTLCAYAQYERAMMGRFRAL